MDSKELSRHAAHVRRNIVKMVTLAQSGHPGGSLSIVDMLQVLYFDAVNRVTDTSAINTSQYFEINVFIFFLFYD